MRLELVCVFDRERVRYPDIVKRSGLIMSVVLLGVLPISKHEHGFKSLQCFLEVSSRFGQRIYAYIGHESYQKGHVN